MPARQLWGNGVPPLEIGRLPPLTEDHRSRQPSEHRHAPRRQKQQPTKSGWMARAGRMIGIYAGLTLLMIPTLIIVQFTTLWLITVFWEATH